MANTTWRLRKSYENDNDIVEVDGCGVTGKVVLLTGTGNYVSLDVEILGEVLKDLTEVEALRDYKEDIVKPLRVIRGLVGSLKIAKGQEERALTLVHVIDSYIKNLTEV